MVRVLHWPTCAAISDCFAASLMDGSGCFLHSSDAHRAEALDRVSAGAPLRFIGGLAVDEDTWTRIKAALPVVDGRPQVPAGSTFMQSRFAAGLNLERTDFLGWVSFSDAVFGGTVSLAGGTFSRGIALDGMKITGTLLLSGAQVHGDVHAYALKATDGLNMQGTNIDGSLRLASVQRSGSGSDRLDETDLGRLDLTNARVVGNVEGHRIRVAGTVSLSDTHLDSDASFQFSELGQFHAGRTTVENGMLDLAGVRCGGLSISASRLPGELLLQEAVVEGPLRLDRSTLGTSRLGPVRVAGDLTAADTTFTRRITADIAATAVDMNGARFDGGGEIRLRCDELRMIAASFGRPTVVRPTPADEHDHDDLKTEAEPSHRPTPPPASVRVTSLEGADTDNLTLVGADMSDCRFRHAHNLDRLRLESGSTFARSSRPRLRRRLLAEERHVRADRTRADRTRADPSDVAAAYRALRRGAEDRRDAAAATDFYYGEMEMRRLDRTTGPTERAVVVAYWLVSGYGLVATRAVAFFVVVCLAYWGLLANDAAAAATGWSQRLVYAVTTMTPVVPTQELELTPAGAVLRLCARITGPILLALAFLAIRNRVRR